MDKWIPLTEYSRAHGLSISTLRRRIKTGELEYKLEDGKYLIKNSMPQVSDSKVSSNIAPPPPFSAEEPAAVESKPASESGAQEFLAITHELVGEIKKAFSLVLQEKEKQILQLKEEVTDLKTLVRVLEDENAKLEKKAAAAVPAKVSISPTAASAASATSQSMPTVRPAKNLIKEELDVASWLNSPSEI